MRSSPEPTRRAFRAAVQMEVHAACSSTTKAKAAVLDEAFPAYDDMLLALREAERVLSGLEIDEDCHLTADIRAAIAKAEGIS